MRHALALAAIMAIACTAGTTTGAPSPAPSVATTPACPPASASSGAVSTTVPLCELRRGGLYILMRHGMSEAGTEAAVIDLDNCATQSNLTEATKRDLATMAADFAALAIPVGSVQASPFCRTLETARIAFGKQVTPNDALLADRPYAPKPGRPTPAPAEQRIAAIKQMLATLPAGGTNIALVSHGEPIRGAIGLDIAPGEAAIVQPDGRAGTRSWRGSRFSAGRPRRDRRM